jgi:hypothetical protein
MSMRLLSNTVQACLAPQSSPKRHRRIFLESRLRRSVAEMQRRYTASRSSLKAHSLPVP